MFNPDRPSRGWALMWPRELFRAELGGVLMAPPLFSADELSVAVELLFNEAFRGPDPFEDFRKQRHHMQLITASSWGASLVSLPKLNPVQQFAEAVLEHVDDLVMYAPRSYYRARTVGPVALHDPRDWSETERVTQVMRAWCLLVRDLDQDGYFDRRGGENCPDNGSADEHTLTLQALVTEHCGLATTWPPKLSNDTAEAEYDFYTLIEVLHDLVDRPRTRQWHDFDQHYTYSNFNEHTGQAVYRWKVNGLLAAHEIDYQLASEGEDTGLLVATTRDPRADLERLARHNVPDGNSNSIDHAIALYRRRGASTDDKRSACVALAGVLESRRGLLKEHLSKQDEGALFEIANKYRIRHHRADQHGDYAPQFLDWIFWNYLATVELSNRLMTRSPSRDHDDA